MWGSFPLDSGGYNAFYANLQVAGHYLLTKKGIDVSEYLKNGIPELIFAQAAMESGDFTDWKWLQCGNCFGMHAPNSRKYYTSVKGSGDGPIACYTKGSLGVSDMKGAEGFGIEPGFVDYLARQKQFGVQPYTFVADTIISGYATTSQANYYKAWMSKFQQIFGLGNPDWVAYWQRNAQEIANGKTGSGNSVRPGDFGVGTGFASFPWILLVLAGAAYYVYNKQKS